MKKIVLVFGLVMALSLVSVASAATLQEQIAALQAQLATLMAQAGGTTASVSSVPTITKSLTIGSKGDEVTALQKYLEEEALLTMPAGVDYGYFGALTKKAVVEWQKANDVSPASGYFGPISRAALDALREAAPVVTPGTPAPVGLDSTDGSVTVAVSPIVSTSQSVKKGDIKDVYAVKFQAVGGKVAINRMDVNFSVRPWLIASQLTIKDSAGNVLATKALSGAADATEITAGSEYSVRFDGLNYVVTPGTDGVLIVNMTIPASNSFVGTTGYTTVYVGVKTGGIRTLNGKGYTDSVGILSAITSGNVLTMSSTGNSADLSVTIAPTSPATGQIHINNSGSDKTSQPLAVYRFRSSTQSSTLNTLVFNIKSDPDHLVDLTTSMKNFQLSDGTNKYGAASVSTAGVVTFSSLNIPLSLDVSKDLTLMADLTATTSVWSASSTLDVSGTVATDVNYNTPTYGGSAISGITSDVTGANLTFTSNSVSVSNLSVTSAANATKLVDANGNPYQYSDVAYNFTITNSSVNDLFISKVLGVCLGTTTVATNASSTINRWANIVSDTGDTTGAYRIPAGSARAFTAYGDVKKRNITTSSEQLNVSSIVYGTSAATPTGQSITTGLENLSFSGTVVTVYP